MSASPIQVARARFVDDCLAVASSLREPRVRELAQAALKVRGETAPFWRRLSRRLMEWRASFDASTAETRILFDGLAGSLRADLTWKSTCETCCGGEDPVCVYCGESGDNGCSHFYGPCPDCSTVEAEVPLMTPETIKRAHEARKAKQLARRQAFHAQRRGLHHMHSVGEASPSSKLTERKVRAIRKRHAKGESMCSIARHYGVTQPCISSIIHRAAWRHVS